MKTLDHRFRSAKADGADASQVQPSHWNDSHQFVGGNHRQVLIRDGTDATYGASWEPHGFWTAVPYDPANFTADAGVIWTVPPANHRLQRWTLIGNTMLYNLWVYQTTINAASTYLHLKVPPPYTAAAWVASAAFYNINGGGEIGYAHINPTEGQAVNFARLSQIPFAAGASLDIALTLTMEVA